MKAVHGLSDSQDIFEMWNMSQEKVGVELGHKQQISYSMSYIILT